MRTEALEIVLTYQLASDLPREELVTAFSDIMKAAVASDASISAKLDGDRYLVVVHFMSLRLGEMFRTAIDELTDIPPCDIPKPRWGFRPLFDVLPRDLLDSALVESMKAFRT